MGMIAKTKKEKKCGCYSVLHIFLEGHMIKTEETFGIRPYLQIPTIEQQTH